MWCQDQAPVFILLLGYFPKLCSFIFKWIYFPSLSFLLRHIWFVGQCKLLPLGNLSCLVRVQGLFSSFYAFALFLYIPQTNEIWHLSSSWLILLDMTPSNSISVVVKGNTSSFLIAESIQLFIYVICINIMLYFSTHLSLDMDCLQVLAIINSAAMNIYVHLSFQISVLYSWDRSQEVLYVFRCKILSLFKIFCYTSVITKVSVPFHHSSVGA